MYESNEGVVEAITSILNSPISIIDMTSKSSPLILEKQGNPENILQDLMHTETGSGNIFFSAHSNNPLENAAAAAAAAGLLDRNLIAASLGNANVSTVNGSCGNAVTTGGTVGTGSSSLNTTTAVLKTVSVQQQQANGSLNSQQQQQQQQSPQLASQNGQMQQTSNSSMSPRATNTQQQTALLMFSGAVSSGTNGGGNVIMENGNSNNGSGSSSSSSTSPPVSTSLAPFCGGGGGGLALLPKNGGGGSGGLSSGRSTPNSNDMASGKLFVGGLSWQTSSEKLKEYFNMFGTVIDVLIMKDPVTQRSRGFGFITFKEAGSVEKVLQVPLHTLDGKKIDPKHATPKNRPRSLTKTKKIFVGGISQDTSAEEVKAYFQQFGAVEETMMLMDQQTKRHRGFGFVTFQNEDMVDQVCSIHFHTIKNKKVECKRAQPKEATAAAAAVAAVTNPLLQKRIILGSLGVSLPPSAATAAGAQILAARSPAAVTAAALNPLATMLHSPANQLQLHNNGATGIGGTGGAQSAFIVQNAFQVQNAAAAAAAASVTVNHNSFGKLLSTYPQAAALHSLRYTPYPLPANTAAAANHLVAQQHQHHQQQQQQQQQQQLSQAHHHQSHQQQQHQQQQSQAQAHQAQHLAALTVGAGNGSGLISAYQQHSQLSSNGSGGHLTPHNVAALASGGSTVATAAGMSGHASMALNAATAQQAALMVAGSSNPMAASAAAAAALNPYQSFALSNVDMSAFQNVDWSSMYGMGMYV